MVHDTKIQFIRPTLCALKCEHNRYTVSYIFWHFLIVIIRGSNRQDWHIVLRDFVSLVFTFQCL